jgi:hypothetical protein
LRRSASTDENSPQGFIFANRDLCWIGIFIVNLSFLLTECGLKMAVTQAVHGFCTGSPGGSRWKSCKDGRCDCSYDQPHFSLLLPSHKRPRHLCLNPHACYNDPELVLTCRASENLQVNIEVALDVVDLHACCQSRLSREEIKDLVTMKIFQRSVAQVHEHVHHCIHYNRPKCPEKSI